MYNPSIKKVLAAINGMPHQLFVAGGQARDILLKLKKYVYKDHSNVTWKEFLSTKLGLLVDTHSSTDNALHDSGRTLEKGGILLQIGKADERSDGDFTYHVFSLEDVVAHLTTSNPCGILALEK